MLIRFYANMRTLIGKDSLEIEELKGGNTLANLFAFLIQQYPQLYPHLFTQEGELRSDVPIFVNGRNPRLGDECLDDLIPSDAEISFFSPIASGKMNVETLRQPDPSKEEQRNEN